MGSSLDYSRTLGSPQTDLHRSAQTGPDCRFLIGLVAVFSVLGTGGCAASGARGAGTPAPTAVVVETAERRDIPTVVELTARLEASATVDIRATVEGRLTEMAFHEGRLLEKGKLLFRVEKSRYEGAVQSAEAAVEKADADVEMAREQQHLVNAQSTLRQAEANLLRANQEVERMRPLAARRAVPQRDLETAIAAQSSAMAAVEDARATVRTTAVGDRSGLRQANANRTMARAALESAVQDLAGTEIHAPISGLIGRADVSVGNYVGRGEPGHLATISQVDPVNAVFGLSEALYLRTVNTVESAALNRIEMILPDGSTYPFRGRFKNIAGQVDEKTGTLLAVAQFANPKALLLPGMTGRVRPSLGIRRGAVLVSEKALFDVQGTKAVYLVTPENRVALQNVVTDGSYQGRNIVTKGLSGGETVIVPGETRLRPGDRVTSRRRPS